MELIHPMVGRCGNSHGGNWNLSGINGLYGKQGCGGKSEGFGGKRKGRIIRKF